MTPSSPRNPKSATGTITRLVPDAIDMTMLQIDIWDDPVGDAAEHDRLRAHHVVEYIRHRFPNVRYDDAP
jgi:hypothetical protein